MVHEQNQTVQEGEAQIHFVRHQMESEQGASVGLIEAISRDIVCQDAHNVRDIYQTSESAAQLPREKFKL